MRATGDATGPAPGMLRSKIAVPRLPATFVSRVHLRERVARAAEAPVVLVCAPAGYGKTLLLADWVDATGAADKAWVSVGASDNDPVRFWDAVLAGLRACDAVPGDNPLRSLRPPGDGDLAGFLAELVDALETVPGRLFLVLDDVHEVTARDTVHGIETVIRHQPATLRLVLSTRADPPLPLARLRMEGKLAMLRADDLRFSTGDAGRLLHASGVSLAPDQLHRLVEHTGGWAAGLRLAARPLRETRDRGAREKFLAGFATEDRAVADYLVGEVLARLPGETVDFLRVISVCDEVDPRLARVLSGRDDAGALLAALERESSLVLAVGRDRRWYRTHPLLRAYLRGDLGRQRPEMVAKLHRAAAVWFASGQQPRKALDHAARAEERDTVANLVRAHAVPLLLNGDHLLVRRALSIVGQRAVAEDPWLALVSALAHLEAGELGAAMTDLAVARGACPEGSDSAEAAAAPLPRLVAATCALARGEVPRLESGQWRAAFAHGPGLESWARLGLGWSLLRGGKRGHARAELDAAERLARAADLDYLVMHCRTARAALSGLDGEYRGMEQASGEAVAIASRHGWLSGPWLGMSRLMLGFARLLRLDVQGALDEAARAADAAGETPEPGLRYLIRLLRGAACFDSGGRAEGFALMRKARWDLAEAALVPEAVVVAALVEYRAALALGHRTAAAEVFRWAKQRAGGRPEMSLMLAWDRFARGETGLAERAADAVLDAPATLVRLEGRLLKSALAIRSGRRTFARTALDEAVRLAGTDELIRPFRQADPAVRALLVEQIGGFGAADAFAARVRRALSDVDTQGQKGNRNSSRGDGPLTEREHMVLARLASQQSLDEVAVDLAVSVNTIKTHVRAIYAKLGVNNRRAAAAAAREHGLT